MPPNFEPHASPTPPAPESRPNVPPPVPNPLRQDHFMPVGEQHTVDVNNLPKNAGNNLFQSNSSSTPNDPSYDFIMNSTEAKHTRNVKMSLPHNTLARVAAGIGGLILLIIVFSVVSSLFKGSSNLPYFESVLEDQQEIIHISSNAANEPDISSNSQTFAATANMTLSSNSSELQSYLAKSGAKISSNTLNLKINNAVDNELSSAETAGTFNSTFNQIAKEQITIYLEDLKTAYAKSSGPNGRILLSSFYNQAKLLLVSLSNGS